MSTEVLHFEVSWHVCLQNLTFRCDDNSLHFSRPLASSRANTSNFSGNFSDDTGSQNLWRWPKFWCVNRSKSAFSNVFMCERFHMLVDRVASVWRKTCRPKSCSKSCLSEHRFRHHRTHCSCRHCTKVTTLPSPRCYSPGNSLLLWHLRPPFTVSQSSPEGLVCCFNLMTCVDPFIRLSVVALLAGDVLALCDSLAVVLLQLLRWVSCDYSLLIVYCLYLLALFLVVWSLELDNQNSTSLGRLCVPYGSCTYAPWLHLNSKMWLWTKCSP